jgi:hypothetical protein
LALFTPLSPEQEHQQEHSMVLVSVVNDFAFSGGGSSTLKSLLDHADTGNSDNT